MATEKTGIGESESGCEARIEPDPDAAKPRRSLAPVLAELDPAQADASAGLAEGQQAAEDLADARSRLERMKLNAAREELRRAELAFLSAKRVLPEGRERTAAERIAEALRRCSLSIDTVEKGLAAYAAIEALEGVSKFDPAADLVRFVEIGGHSLALAARELARCSVASVEYWGRQLERLAEEFEG